MTLSLIVLIIVGINNLPKDQLYFLYGVNIQIQSYFEGKSKDERMTLLEYALHDDDAESTKRVQDSGARGSGTGSVLWVETIHRFSFETATDFAFHQAQHDQCPHHDAEEACDPLRFL